MKRLLAFLLAAVMLCAFAGVGAQAGAPKKEIAAIYASTSNAWLQPLVEYKIDLAGQAFYSYISPWDYWDIDEYIPRDAAAENEGYDAVRPLDAGKIECFRRRAALSGFTQWRDDYWNGFILDGYHWDVIATFTDGTETAAGGWNAYPLFGWDLLHYALLDLTGESVLGRMGCYGWTMNFLGLIVSEITVFFAQNFR